MLLSDLSIFKNAVVYPPESDEEDGFSTPESPSAKAVRDKAARTRKLEVSTYVQIFRSLNVIANYFFS